MVFIVNIDLNVILVISSKVDKFLQYSILIKDISINRKQVGLFQEVDGRLLQFNRLLWKLC